MWGVYILGVWLVKTDMKKPYPIWVWRPSVSIFFSMDFLFDSIFGTVIFIEGPRDVTFTRRVNRHKFESTGWRRDLALWICKVFFEPWDCRHCDGDFSNRFWR